MFVIPLDVAVRSYGMSVDVGFMQSMRIAFVPAKLKRNRSTSLLHSKQKPLDSERPSQGQVLPRLPRELMQWNSPRGIGGGLRNLGNTCFLNSVASLSLSIPDRIGSSVSTLRAFILQCAAFSKPFEDMFSITNLSAL